MCLRISSGMSVRRSLRRKPGRSAQRAASASSLLANVSASQPEKRQWVLADGISRNEHTRTGHQSIVGFVRIGSM